MLKIVYLWTVVQEPNAFKFCSGLISDHLTGNELFVFVWTLTFFQEVVFEC